MDLKLDPLRRARFHWGTRDVSVTPEVWETHFPHYKPRELACPCCGWVDVDVALMRALEALRVDLGEPIIVTSGYRCAVHNRAVGGVPHSQHRYGRAADIRPGDKRRAYQLIALAMRRGLFTGYGLRERRPPGNLIHLDIGAPTPPKGYTGPSPRPIFWTYP